MLHKSRSRLILGAHIEVYPRDRETWRKTQRGDEAIQHHGGIKEKRFQPWSQIF